MGLAALLTPINLRGDPSLKYHPRCTDRAVHGSRPFSVAAHCTEMGDPSTLNKKTRSVQKRCITVSTT